MSKEANRLAKAGRSYVLGDRMFSAITAVEGIRLSKSSRRRLALLKKRKLTPDEQRSEVIRAYKEAKTR